MLFHLDQQVLEVILGKKGDLTHHLELEQAGASKFERFIAHAHEVAQNIAGYLGQLGTHFGMNVLLQTSYKLDTLLEQLIERIVYALVALVRVDDKVEGIVALPGRGEHLHRMSHTPFLFWNSSSLPGRLLRQSYLQHWR